MCYDLIVIGSGPAGQKGAIAAAKMNKRVALVERRRQDIGGVCLHTGTIPSKTIREAILHLTGYRQREVYAERYRHKRRVTMDTYCAVDGKKVLKGEATVLAPSRKFD